MRRFLLGWFIAASALTAGGIAACGSQDDAIDEGGYADYGGNYASSSGTQTNYGGYGSGVGGAGGGGSVAPPTPPPIAPEPDAGELTCEGLDPSTPLVLYISADDSNSMASAGHAREALLQGQAPVLPIRTYELLNYYNIDYPAAPLGQLAIYPQMEAAVDAGQYDLQIGVRSFDAVTPRRPITITFVLDTSGSMGGKGMERERAVVLAIASVLAPGDIVNMVTWSSSNATVLSGHVVSGPNDTTLVQIAQGLDANGSTDLHGGLVAGYDLAQQHYGEQRLNRVVLISDGMANTGITDEQLIAQHSEDADGEGIYMVGVGVGPVNVYNDLLMDKVTDEGRGAYVYVDSPEEAQELFVDRFDEVMEVAARGVQVELTLPWYFQMHKFYGEEYSPDPKEVKPQHLAPSDAMIFAQVLKACDPGEVNVADEVTIRATWETPLTYLPMETSVTMTLQQLLDGDKGQLHKGKAIVAYAEALKSGLADDLAAAHAAAVAVNAGGTDDELNEIVELIEAHPAY